MGSVPTSEWGSAPGRNAGGAARPADEGSGDRIQRVSLATISDDVHGKYFSDRDDHRQGKSSESPVASQKVPPVSRLPAQE